MAALAGRNDVFGRTGSPVSPRPEPTRDAEVREVLAEDFGVAVPDDCPSLLP